MTDQFAHLLRRAGFGAGPQELDEYRQLGYEGAVDRLVNYGQVDNSALDAAVPAIDFTKRGTVDIGTAWLYRMLHTKRPLEEKMTLFWHGHFATAESKVGNARWMWQQNALFRANAVGSFADLVLAVSKDAAMLKWLDGDQNHKQAPNENYGRELMELFTLGVGNYTEDDVHAAAHAFTGWRTNREGQFQFVARDHDDGVKTFLGQTGNWNGDDVISIIMQQPAHATFLMRKLYRFFVDPNPSDAVVQQYADLYTKSNFAITPVLQAMFTSKEFLGASAYHALIKSPAEYVVGSLKLLGIDTLPKNVTAVMKVLGQELFNPPNVAGWPGGPAWFNTGTALDRYNLANHLVTARTKDGTSWNPPADLSGMGSSAADVVGYYANLLLDGDLTDTTRAALVGYLNGASGFTPDASTIDDRVRGVVHLTMISPTYSLS